MNVSTSASPLQRLEIREVAFASFSSGRPAKRSGITLKMSTDEAMYKLFHVFLPPKNPQADDTCPEYSKSLLETVIKCLSTFQDYVEESERPVVSLALEAMR